MSRQIHRYAKLSWTVLLLVVANPTAKGADRPMNVVFILVDDLGWSDLGCYGSDFHESPNIDRFCHENLQFTNAYAASPVCSPTRAAIMTGKHPARLGMTIWHEGAVDGGPTNRKLRPPKAVPNLPHSERTLAEIFREAGYFTAHVGKWHLGKAAYYPETQGFDVNVGGTFWGAPATFFYPFSGPWSKSNPEFRYVPGLGSGKKGDYLTDKLTDRAIEILDQVADRPFFLNLWFHTVHSPIEGQPEWVQHFQKKRKGNVHSEPTYAAMIKSLDVNVGRVLEKLDKLQLVDQTIVVITSDNGGVDFPTRTVVPTSNTPLRSGKGTLYEGGTRVPLMIRWPKRTPRGKISEAQVCSMDFWPTLMEGLELRDDPENERDGVSILSQLSQPETEPVSRTLFWHYPHYYPRMTPGSSVRFEKWKLIHSYEDNQYELYDLEADIAETRNLSKTHSKILEMMQAKLEFARQGTNAAAPIRNE